MIQSFDKQFAYLSNFFPSPILLNGQEWPTVEHVFQAAKTLDSSEQEQIRLAETPGKAKRLGQKVHLRSDWETCKHAVMVEAVRLKFSQYPELLNRLLSTGEEELVEGNTWHDNVWGDCQCPRCQNIPGRNLLGTILMQIRRDLADYKGQSHV
ncbi:MAG: hypothetical protein QG599_3730 [Pseudomonadota bacterium]|nr:hypothetical protein [Pseudomonadota bacterium]